MKGGQLCVVMNHHVFRSRRPSLYWYVLMYTAQYIVRGGQLCIAMCSKVKRPSLYCYVLMYADAVHC